MFVHANYKSKKVSCLPEDITPAAPSFCKEKNK